MTKAQQRFTLPQLELFRAWQSMGATEAHQCRVENKSDAFDVIDFFDDDNALMGSVILDSLTKLLDEGETIDLYDLLKEEE